MIRTTAYEKKGGRVRSSPPHSTPPPPLPAPQVGHGVNIHAIPCVYIIDTNTYLAGVGQLEASLDHESAAVAGVKRQLPAADDEVLASPLASPCPSLEKRVLSSSSSCIIQHVWCVRACVRSSSKQRSSKQGKWARCLSLQLKIHESIAQPK